MGRGLRDLFALAGALPKDLELMIRGVGDSQQGSYNSPDSRRSKPSLGVVVRRIDGSVADLAKDPHGPA